MTLAAWWRGINKARLGHTLHALWLLMRHPQTPIAPKIIAALVVTYALSPIDLIPDFIPVLGLLDDIVLIPLGVALVIKLTPAPLWQALLAQAEANPVRLGKTVWGVVLVLLVWTLLAGFFAWWIVSLFAPA
jgi:uncharacterized membrane protein YkvA (DUF1232 family)